MTKSELRHFCRHCRGKLTAPTANHREAFDSKGCHRSYYRHRCIVCERDMPRNRENQRTCYRAECKIAWRQKTVQSHFLGIGSTPVKDTTKTSIKPGIKPGLKPDRAWHIVAGEIGPSAFHCATVPDGPGCKWEGGPYERIEAQNRRLLKAHVAELGEKAVIQRQHMPLNIQGGYRPRYRLLKHQDGSDACRAPDPVIPGMGYDRQAAVNQPESGGKSAALIATIPDDLSIPAFLLRRPQEPKPLARAA